MRKLIVFLPCFLVVGLAFSQGKITVPDTLSGSVIDLFIAQSTYELIPGKTAHTIGYNGSYLGKTILLQKGQQVTLNVHNMLPEPTTTHWHGLHVAPMNDGSPHMPIASQETWSPTFTVMDHAATYWYHPHLHEKTLEQVVRGAAGMIIVRDEQEQFLPIPRSYGKDDFPLALQFITLNNQGDIVENDELDNTILVNGVSKGVLECPAEWVRLRLLNASSHRVFNIGLENNQVFYQITSDAGMLKKPVTLTRLRLASGERAEILINLSGKEGKMIQVIQFGNELPAGFPGGPAMGMMGGMTLGPLDNKTTTFMTLQVLQGNNFTKSLPAILSESENIPTSSSNRSFGITAQPMMSTTNFFINNKQFNIDEINFKTKLGNTETWTITNQTMMAHPFHVHGNHFFITEINGAPPPENMTGRKDVVMVPAMNGRVKLVTTFADFSDETMPYMYHCHILSHEDNGMMGQFVVQNQTSVVSGGDPEKGLSVSNPAKDRLFIHGSIPFGQGASFYQIISASGQFIFQSQQIINDIFNRDVDCSTWPPGNYVLLVKDETNRVLQSLSFIKL